MMQDAVRIMGFCGWSRRERARREVEAPYRPPPLMKYKVVDPSSPSFHSLLPRLHSSLSSGIGNEHILFRSISPERSARERVRPSICA